MAQTAFHCYAQTWNWFVNQLETNLKITLRTVCKMHTDYGLMKKWTNRIGYSVIKE